jgi:Ca2+-binding RTX toxin-like protein
VSGAASAVLAAFNANTSSIEVWQGNGKGLLGTSGANVFSFAGLSSKNGLPFVDGAGGNDTLTGSKFADDLRGSGGIDNLIGGAAADLLTGGTGKDTMTGGAGPDTFRFSKLGDTGATAATADLIQDFNQTPGQHDHITLSEIDANGALPGHPHFSFIGTNPFTANHPAQAREFFSGNDTFVALNTDQDAAAEGLIHLHGHFVLHAGAGGDFIL